MRIGLLQKAIENAAHDIIAYMTISRCNTETLRNLKDQIDFQQEQLKLQKKTHKRIQNNQIEVDKRINLLKERLERNNIELGIIRDRLNREDKQNGR